MLPEAPRRDCLKWILGFLLPVQNQEAGGVVLENKFHASGPVLSSTEEARFQVHLAPLLDGSPLQKHKTQPQRQMKILLMCNWSGLGLPSLDRHGNVGGALGFGSKPQEPGFRLDSQKCCMFVISLDFSWS